MKICKKIWPEYFEKIKSGKKKFELRLADFKAKPNDVLVLKEWNPKTQQYTGKVINKKITYVIKTKDLNFWSDDKIKKYGYQILQIV